jgi:cytochrome c-type biogenesis protein
MPEIGGVGLLTALFAGAISFLSPCVLPLVPGYLSAVTGLDPSEIESSGWRAVVPPALVFIASFSAVFMLLGLGAVGIGRTLNQNGETLDRISGALIIAMGLLFASSMFVDRFNREWRVDALMERAGSGGPLIAGMAFAIAWSPCVGPTLGAILSLGSVSGSLLEGALTLAVYSAGLAIPFLLSAIAFTRMTTAFDWVRKHYRVIMGAGGVVLIVMGVLVFTGELTELNIRAQQWMDDLGLNFWSSV